MAVKQAWPVLIRNAQRITKAARGDQQRGFALALQQRVGGHGGAHLHALNQRGRDRLARFEPQQMPDAGHRSVAVLLGVLGQELVRDERKRPVKVGPFGNDVGECAAPVNPELPPFGGPLLACSEWVGLHHFLCITLLSHVTRTACRMALVEVYAQAERLRTC